MLTQDKLIGLLIPYSTETLIGWYYVFSNGAWATDFVIKAPANWDFFAIANTQTDHSDYCLIMDTFEHFFSLSRDYLIAEEKKDKAEFELWETIKGTESEAEIAAFCKKLDAIRGH
jgi:hypothetical protein